MPPADHPGLVRLLWAAVSVFLLAALIALPVVADAEDGPADVKLGAAVTTTTAAAAGAGSADETTTTATAATTSAPASGVEGTEATTAPTTTPATFPPPADDLGAPQDPGPAVPPRAGVYRYRTTGSGAGGDGGESETTTRVEDRGRDGDEIRQSVTASGGRFTVTSDLAWRPDGLVNLRATFTAGDRKGDCDWDPGVLELRLPLAAGVTWSAEGSCALTGIAPTPIALQRRVTGEVVDLRRVRIAGEIVDVWAIRRTETLSGAGFSADTTALALFSPKFGIDVDVSGTVSSPQGNGEYRRELRNLVPDPLG